MSKITVTTIAGATSGSDANKVKIESGDTLEVVSNATVGGTLGVTGNTQVTGNLGVGVAPERKFHVEGSGAEFSLVDTSRPTDKKTINMFIDANGKGNIRMMNDAQSAGNAAIVIEGSSPHTAPAVRMPYQPSLLVRKFPSVSSGNNIVGGAVEHDIGSNYNSSNGRFTAPIAGRYFVSFGCLTNAGNGRLELELHKNGTLFLRANESTGPSNYGGATNSGVISLNANDYINLYLSLGTMYSIHENNIFSVHLLA